MRIRPVPRDQLSPKLGDYAVCNDVDTCIYIGDRDGALQVLRKNPSFDLLRYQLSPVSNDPSTAGWRYSSYVLDSKARDLVDALVEDEEKKPEPSNFERLKKLQGKSDAIMIPATVGKYTAKGVKSPGTVVKCHDNGDVTVYVNRSERTVRVPSEKVSKIHALMSGD